MIDAIDQRESGFHDKNLPNVTLEQGMNELLNQIPPLTPETFKNSAKKAAEYITLLDQGKASGNSVIQQFLVQLNSSMFIEMVRVHDKPPFFRKRYPPAKEALPVWLQSDYLANEGITQPDLDLSYSENQLESLYDQWGKQLGAEPKNGVGGTLFVLSQSSQAPLPRQYKCYIEGKDIYNFLQSGKLTSFVKDLQARSIGPNRSKLYEGNRLVLYFDHDYNDSDQVEQLMSAYGIPYRGPAQDVYEVRQEGDKLKTRFSTSNDGGLGEGNHNPIAYGLQKYNPTDFLRNYLDMCLYAGKSPDKPYATNFVYFMDENPELDISLLQRAQKLTGYPILHAESRHKHLSRSIFDYTK